MKKNTKICLFNFILILVNSSIFAMGKQSSQLIKAGHWLYDDLTLLSTESGITFILDVQPMSIGEINFFFNQLDYDKLSNSGKEVYNRVQKFLGKKDDFVVAEEFRFFLNGKLNPEFFYKTNKNIDWSFSPYYIKDNGITMPVIIGFSDFFTFQSDFFYGKSQIVVPQPDNFTNLAILPKHSNFNYPDFSYFSFSKTFNKWGVSSHIGKRGFQIGNPHMESILYSKLFDTDFYVQMNLFNNYMKYSMDVTQVSRDKYVYIHQLTFRPWKFCNLTILEGSLINAPFELRYMNPFNIMHEYAGWHDYDKTERGKYGESNFCAYLGLMFDIVPVKNLRIYGLYAQNEMIDPGNGVSKESLSVPSSFGGQVGAEYIFALDNNAHLKTNVEVVYTSPFLYLKASPNWSLYSERGDEYGNGTFSTWMGSPAGPDSFIVNASAKYDSNKKWDISASYKFMIHGDNYYNTLFSNNNKIDITDEGTNVIDYYWNYYPYIKYRHANGNTSIQDAAVAEATNLWMSGNKEYSNQIKVLGNYRFYDNLELTGQVAYSFNFNNDNILNNFQQGIELAIALTYEIF